MTEGSRVPSLVPLVPLRPFVAAEDGVRVFQIPSNAWFKAYKEGGGRDANGEAVPPGRRNGGAMELPPGIRLDGCAVVVWRSLWHGRIVKLRIAQKDTTLTDIDLVDLKIGKRSQFLSAESMPVSLFREPRSMYTSVASVQQDVAFYFAHDGEGVFPSLTIDVEIQPVPDKDIEALNAR